MPRHLVSMVLCGLLSLLAGCHHIAGVCDCTNGCPACAAGSPPVGTPMVWLNGTPGGSQPSAPTPAGETQPAPSSTPISVVDVP